jgi:hypothetical protein
MAETVSLKKETPILPGPALFPFIFFKAAGFFAVYARLMSSLSIVRE